MAFGDGKIRRDEINSDFNNQLTSYLLHTGDVLYTTKNIAPTGTLKANGLLLSRTTYANLFSVIGTTFGSGDGSTTFQLPDLRGQFIRGYDDGANIDTSRVFGSTQADLYGSHSHTIKEFNNQYTFGLGTGYASSGVFSLSGVAGNIAVNSDLITNIVGGTETRPKNIALLACIIY